MAPHRCVKVDVAVMRKAGCRLTQGAHAGVGLLPREVDQAGDARVEQGSLGALQQARSAGRGADSVLIDRPEGRPRRRLSPRPVVSSAPAAGHRVRVAAESECRSGKAPDQVAPKVPECSIGMMVDL